MKFNFERNSKKVEKPEEMEKPLSEEEKQLLEEIKQQRYEEECIAEADKLKVNLSDLKKQIDDFGGAEKFKEHFEKVSSWQGENEDGSKNNVTNVAGNSNNKISSEIRYEKRHFPSSLIATAGFAAIAVLMNMVGSNDVAIDHSSILEAIKGIQEGITSGSVAMNYFPAGFATLFGGTAIMTGVGAVKMRLESRKLNRQKKIDNLKYKMTDTEVLEGNQG